MGLFSTFFTSESPIGTGPIELTEVDELQVKSLAENIIKDAVRQVNPEAEAETKTGLEPRYYLKLEIKAALRQFEKNHNMHFGMITATSLKKNDQGHSFFDYIHTFFVNLIIPHFEGGCGENNIHPRTYIRYFGGPEVAEKFPEIIENALAAYQNNERLETDPHRDNNGRIEPRLH